MDRTPDILEREFAIHLGKRLQAVVLASRSLVQRLHVVHADAEYKAVWEVAQLHRGPYQGPKYDIELKELESILENSQGADEANEKQTNIQTT